MINKKEDSETRLSISQCDEWGKVTPNCIFNRYDLLDPDNAVLLRIVDKKNDGSWYAPFRVEGKYAYVGGWLTSIDSIYIQAIIDHIFTRYESVKEIILKRSLTYDNNIRNSDVIIDNDWHIDLPVSSEDLEKRLTKKSRYNLKREKRILESAFGSVQYIHKSAYEAKDVVDVFFEYKKKTHAQDFHMSSLQYIEDKKITDIYYIEADGIILSIVLSCNQCPCVFCENLAYNLQYKKYSPGKILYDWYIKNLIIDKKEKLFLLGGELEYKSKYGAVEEKVYDYVFYRNAFYLLINKHILSLPVKVWNMIPESIRRAVRTLFRKLKLRDFNHV